MLIKIKPYKKQDQAIRIKILKLLNNIPGHSADEGFLLQHFMNEGVFNEVIRNQLHTLTQDKSIDKIEKDGIIKDSVGDEEIKVQVIEYSIGSQGLEELFDRSERRSNIWRRFLP